MSKFVKTRIVTAVVGSLNGSVDVLAVDISRLTGNEANGLRNALSQKSITMLTVKSSLARVVFRKSGMSEFAETLKGPVTLTWGASDVVELSREITAWSKKIDRMAVIGAAVQGQVLNSDQVVELSKSPGRAELLSKISQLITTPGSNLLAILNGPGASIQSLLKSKSE